MRVRKALLLTLVVCLCTTLLYPWIKVGTAGDTGKVLVDVLLDYGNGTRRWASCILECGATVYNATELVAATLNVTWYDGASFVDAIDGVWNSYPYYWIWWYWNRTEAQWKLGEVACNQQVLEDLEIVAWYYENCTVWPPEQPLNPPTIKVDVLLDYGNGTTVWHENVDVTGYTSVFKATKLVASVEYSLWNSDVWVDAIDGVWNNYSANYFWLYWCWNHTTKSWDMVPVACNKYVLANGDIVAWFYETSPWGPPATTPHPTASFTWAPSIPKVGEAVTFDASASTPNGGTIIKYEWDFGDGNRTFGKTVLHTYNSSGTYLVTLNVSDSNGLWDIEQKQLTVVKPQGPKASFTVVPETAWVGENIKFDASTSQPGWNGTHTMPITEYRWNFGDGNITVTTQPIIYHKYNAAGNYYVTLTVYAHGATPETNSTTVRISVLAVPVGGWSVSVKTPTAENLTVYLVSVATITAFFAAIRRKLTRR